MLIFLSDAISPYVDISQRPWGHCYTYSYLHSRRAVPLLTSWLVLTYHPAEDTG